MMSTQSDQAACPWTSPAHELPTWLWLGDRLKGSGDPVLGGRSYEAMPERERSRFAAAIHADLLVHERDVTLDRPITQEQDPGNFLVAQTLSKQAQHF
jgi:hypothetical protein